MIEVITEIRGFQREVGAWPVAISQHLAALFREAKEQNAALQQSEEAGLEAGAGRLAGRTDRAEPLPQRLGPPAESASRGATEAARRADLGLDPSGVVGVLGRGGADSDPGRVGSGALPEVRAVEPDSRAVDAAAVATAQAQLVAAEAAIERAARQLAEAGERLERQAEQQRALELEAKQAARAAEWKRRELEEEKGRGLGD